MRTLNLGILAHVDAGKTTLTERLLFAAGVIDEIGSVDDGSTQTDTLPLEQKRGITIKSAVVSFVVGDATINLIDTPGHPDFIAEIERVLNVLDGAVLVVSAVDGVQAQTRVLMRTLQRLKIPTLIFANKIDRAGAQQEGLLRSISKKLTPANVPMGYVGGLGTREVILTPHEAADQAFTTRLVDELADYDDVFLAAYLDDDTMVSYGWLRGELAARRSGPANKRAPGRRSARDLRLALRRGAEGGHPVDPSGRFDCYRPVGGTIPTRPRTDKNPLYRREYLLRVARWI